MNQLQIPTSQKFRDYWQVSKAAICFKRIPGDRLSVVQQALARYSQDLRYGYVRHTFDTAPILVIAILDYCPEWQDYATRLQKSLPRTGLSSRAYIKSIAAFMRVPERIAKMLTYEGRASCFHDFKPNEDPYNDHVLFGSRDPEFDDAHFNSVKAIALVGHIEKIKNEGFKSFDTWHYESYWECVFSLKKAEHEEQQKWFKETNLTVTNTSNAISSSFTPSQTASRMAGETTTHYTDGSRVFDLATYHLLATGLDDTPSARQSSSFRTTEQEDCSTRSIPKYSEDTSRCTDDTPTRSSSYSGYSSGNSSSSDDDSSYRSSSSSYSSSSSSYSGSSDSSSSYSSDYSSSSSSYSD